VQGPYDPAGGHLSKAPLKLVDRNKKNISEDGKLQSSAGSVITVKQLHQWHSYKEIEHKGHDVLRINISMFMAKGRGVTQLVIKGISQGNECI